MITGEKIKKFSNFNVINFFLRIIKKLKILEYQINKY